MDDRTMVGRRRFASALLAVTLLVGLAAAPIEAQEGQRVAPGSIVPRVVSATDPSQTYALYIPSAYDASRPWPLLVIMDPRGRAVQALQPFQVAAERRGWIVMSGYGTESNGPVAPNAAAVNAMISDASATFDLDARRVYLAGQSGTARVAWQFAVQLGSRVAGIYGAGAGGTALTRFIDPPKGLVFFGSAGDTDFNYDEVRGLEPWLEAHGVPHRLRFFRGGHEWPPAAVAAEAVDWFELKAMQMGHEPLREPFVDSLLRTDMAAADSLEAAGRGADALDRYKEIVADYGSKASEAQEDVARLAQDSAVQAEMKRRLQERYAFEDFMGRVTGWVTDLVQSDQATPAAGGIHILGIEDLKAKAAAPDTPPETLSAIRRRLNSAHVLLAFYQPRAFLRASQPAKALVVLDVAAAIRDDDPTALVFRAEADAELGQTDAALNALERAVSLGASAAGFKDDPHLQHLRGEARYRALVGGR